MADFDGVAEQLGLNTPDEPTPSTYIWDLQGSELGAAIVERFDQQRTWLEAQGLLAGWRLKLAYWHSEFRQNPTIAHLNILEQWGANGEFTAIGINHLRSILKTLLGSVVQNPPVFTCKSTNSDANALEAASLYSGVLDYYSRTLRLNQKIANATEMCLVVDQSFILTEWNPFAPDAEAPDDGSIYKGSPGITVLPPWSVAYDVLKPSWEDLNWVICRDWIDRQTAKIAFPELGDEIEGCPNRAQVALSHRSREPSRYDMAGFTEMSDDIECYKFFHKPTASMPHGRHVMCLSSGQILFESPMGLIYPKLPVDRMVADDDLDILIGHSPINELLAIQESINSIESAINGNAMNFSSQFVTMQTGSEINPRTLANGMAILEYPPGSQPPQGLNLTAIPNILFEHVNKLEEFMRTLAAVPQSNRGQAGNNQTGSAMLFLSSASTSSQGQLSQNFSDFSCAVMTSLIRVLKTFAKTERTIRIMGKNPASRTIVMSDALQDFDEITAEESNPMLATPGGRMQMAQSLLQFGDITPQQVLQVASSGTLSSAIDPVRDQLWELGLENEWLINGDQILVSALDQHEDHIKQHKLLLSTPWLRKPALASQLKIPNAPEIMQNIMDHIQQHMSFLSGNSVNTAQSTAGMSPGAPQPAPSAALGHAPAANGNDGAQLPVQTSGGIQMPSQPSPPVMPR